MRETGRELEGDYFDHFLNIGMTFAFFESSGTDSVLIECVKMVVRTGARSTTVSRMTLAAMASGPVALLP